MRRVDEEVYCGAAQTVAQQYRLAVLAFPGFFAKVGRYYSVQCQVVAVLSGDWVAHQLVTSSGDYLLKGQSFFIVVIDEEEGVHTGNNEKK